MPTTYFYGNDAQGNPIYESSTPNGVINPSQAITATSLQPVAPINIPLAPVPADVNPIIAGGNAILTANGTTLTPATTDTSTSDFQKMIDSIGLPPSTASLYNTDYANSGIPQAQTDVNAKAAKTKEAQSRLAGINAQIAGITAQGQAMNLQQEGRQAPTFQITGQQAENNRQTAIRAIPLQIQALATQAEVASAQGDQALSQSILQQAQQHLDTVFQIHQTDATNQYNYKKDLVSKVYDFATKKEQAKLDEIKTKQAQDFIRQNSMK